VAEGKIEILQNLSVRFSDALIYFNVFTVGLKVYCSSGLLTCVITANMLDFSLSLRIVN